MGLFFPLLVPAAVRQVLGDSAEKLDIDPILSKKVKGTGVQVSKIIEVAAEACATSSRVRESVDKVGSWLACMDEVLGRVSELFASGVPLDDERFSAVVDGSGKTLRDVALPVLEVCRRNTARVLEDREEDAMRCSAEVITVARLRLKELFA